MRRHYEVPYTSRYTSRLSKLLIAIPRLAVLFGGAAVGVIAAVWRSLEGGKTSAARLPTAPKRATILYVALQTQIARLEDRVDRQDMQLRAIPSPEQIASAIDGVFERSSKALDERIAEQSRSIESLKAMVSQTDELLEKVLDSIYSLPEMSREPEAEPDARGLTQ